MKIAFVFICLVVPLVTAQLRVGFYNPTCPQAEKIVRDVVLKRFRTDRSITAALLRMHFHDCFVRGCDASILIDSTKTKSSEKDAGPNLTVRGYELIDEAKKALEIACPETVSCADIITIATRDSVALAGGQNYNVTTGRRDGLVSDPSLVNLPGPTASVSQALSFFTAKKMTLNDMVTLLGAHTVGVAHCSFFQDRLSNFQGTGRPDPTMDPALVSKLSTICGRPNNPTAVLDQNTSFVVDNEFYRQIRLNRGVMQIDQELASDKASAPIVANFANNAFGFQQSFANAMVKMGGIEVLVGKSGEIRKNCRVFNPPPTQKKSSQKRSKVPR
ncbi:LOW QUALITY PROTEIN: peroxidase 44-like [Actinidia eriantha]|uniref:LOW QUALITY PROTEIN: peroxidase 44-like n=1 Tax=Actinidia eriantha TaxID=165200 RepID=UPI002587C174|nr:LOW QUALITY PROTEIN: peroxidase 44-like [Actinidia eriantha]